MLFHIQQEQPLKVADAMLTGSDPERLQLKISNALANVAIIDHDIVALIGRLTFKKLEVIVSAQLSTDENTLITPSRPSSFSQFWDFIVTKNFRKSELESVASVRDPFIISPTMPQGLESDDDEAINRHIDKHWSHPNLADHLWILSRLLVMKEPSDAGPQTGFSKPTRLIEYVIATCFPKILRRLQHPLFSEPYIASLKDMNDPAEIKGLVESQKNNPASLSPKEIENDRLFLGKFLLPSLSSKLIKLPLPNLFEQAKLAEKKEAFQLYSGETCAEFHLLLVELIKQFSASLAALQHSRGNTSRHEFRLDLIVVRLYGYALQRLARGGAIQTHLKAITPLLEKYRGNFVSTSIPKMDKVYDEDNKEPYEEDEELQQVQPSVDTEEGVPTPLWKSYRDWLRLIMVHFDAVDILVAYVTGPTFQQEAISIKILVTPPVDNSLLSWTELFTDPKYFPTSALDPLFNQTNDRILKFLQNAAASNPGESLGWAKGAMKWFNKGNTKKVTENLRNIARSSKLPGWRECADKLLATLQDVPLKLSPSSRDIRNSIQSLCDSATFFNSLNDKAFTGTLHCEVSLVSFLRYRAGHVEVDGIHDDISVQIKDFGRVIGVSKRCCPTCQHLLSLLAPDSKSPFLVRGSHNTVTACTLPTWLPEDIVDSMNEFFGAKLRRELLDLMNRSELMRNRTRSTGSQRLSLDSATGWSGDNEPIISSDMFFEATSRIKQYE